MKANIYSIEALAPASREAVYHGIETVAAYIGENVTTKELRVRLPMNDKGHVVPERVGFRNLDMYTELHFFAVPLDRGDSERVGLAGLASGVGFVDTTVDFPDFVRVVCAHETSHALGFVSADAVNVDPCSPHHCCDGNCVMHKKVVTICDPQVSQPSLANRLKKCRKAYLA